MSEKYFIYQNYINKVCLLRKKIKINLLSSHKFKNNDIKRIWYIIENKNYKLRDIDNVKIFDSSISLQSVNWHKDYISNYEYALKRYDKIKIEQWFDKGIDVKLPWEVSRFYFAIQLAQHYSISRDEKYYIQFKGLYLDWVEKNPFLYGVNWICPMEAAIRSINWIVAVNLFGDIFDKDSLFKEIFSKSLLQHAEYIFNFPEIYEKGHTTNHTTADYAGLLFIALSLKEHTKYKKWLKKAIDGLEHCIRYQTYEDGVNFEASIPYHRLVLEMFAYSAIICKANKIEFSNKYYELLFKMFEYTAAYIDHNGNAPQVGDNDSGRILVLHESDEHDHSYLLDLGEHIFNYKFRSQCLKRNPEFVQWLPKIDKIDINCLDIKPRETDKSIAFEKGGANFLKNENFSLMVYCFPIGQNGRGGHNHYDTGSFTLSFQGNPVVVDPGTYTYTRKKKERDKFRAIQYHNSVFTEKSLNIDIPKTGYWETTEISRCNKMELTDKSISLTLAYKDTPNIIKRIFMLSNEYMLITDSSNTFINSIIHFAPAIQLIKKDAYCFINTCFDMVINSQSSLNTKLYDYSICYDKSIQSEMIFSEHCLSNEIKISFDRKTVS